VCVAASCSLPVGVYASYRSGEVDGHQGVRRQEEVVEPHGVFEVRQHVAVPRDEPGQREDGPHLRSVRHGKHTKGM